MLVQYEIGYTENPRNIFDRTFNILHFKKNPRIYFSIRFVQFCFPGDGNKVMISCFFWDNCHCNLMEVDTKVAYSSSGSFCMISI